MLGTDVERDAEDADELIELISSTSVDLAMLHTASPVGVAVVDARGLVRYTNNRMLAMLGRSLQQVIGRSVLEFAHPDDLRFVLDVLADGGRFTGSIIGPARLRYFDGSGVLRNGDVWGRDCLGHEGIDGFVITLAEESITDELTAATRAMVLGAPLESVLGHVVNGLGRRPFRNDAAVLTLDDGVFTPVGAWPIGGGPDDRWLSTGGDAPWQVAYSNGVSVDVARPDELAVDLAAACRRAGAVGVWCRPVVTGDRQVSSVLVVWQDEPGVPTVNQAQHLDDAVAVIALALDQLAYHKSMERAVYIDALTGLGNRARLEQLLSLPDDDITGVLYLDLDGFKDVNDRYGHAAGDEVLVQVSDRLRRTLRSSDEVLRIGGDEFVVVCRSVSPDEIQVVADRVTRLLQSPYRLSGVTNCVEVSASVGSDVSAPGRPLSERMASADAAMYSAKSHFKSRWRRRGDR